MMKVVDLILLLQEFDDNDLVVMSKDEEGNGFDELRVVEGCVYADGEIHPRSLTDEDREQGFTDDDLYSGDDGVEAVCLWP